MNAEDLTQGQSWGGVPARGRGNQLAPLLPRPLGLFCDLDGTLAPIASWPGEARIHPDALRTLVALQRRLDLVAIVSGRPVQAVRAMLGLRGLVCVGNHGLEIWQRGRARMVPGAAPWRRVMARLSRDLEERGLPPGILLEPKGLALGIHYRLSQDPEAARAHILEALARSPLARQALVVEERRVVEVRPSLPYSKGTAVTGLIEERGLRGAIYMGDDRTDLDAFRALRQLAERGRVRALVVAVRSAEAPLELLQEADWVVEGPAGALALLSALATGLNDGLQVPELGLEPPRQGPLLYKGP